MIDPIVYLIPLGVIALGFIVASSKRGSVTRTEIGSRREELHSPAEPATVFARLRTLGGRYRVDDHDAERGILVLSSPPTLMTWGFLYPIHIHAEGSGARIIVGIESRFIQWGPLVTRAHNQCLQAIEDLLGVPVARVA